MLDWIDSAGSWYFMNKAKAADCGYNEKQFGCPLTMYTLSWILVLCKARVIGANPRVLRGTSPAPTSSLSACDNGSYDSL